MSMKRTAEAEQAKNKEKTRKAQETRAKNAAAKQQAAPIPTTMQNIPPSMSSPVPPQLCPQQPQTAIPSTPWPLTTVPSTPRPPFIPISVHQSVQSSRIGLSQVHPPSDAPLLQWPQNYQPQYPLYAPLSSSPLPLTSSPAPATEIDQFSAMIACLTPAQMNALLTMPQEQRLSSANLNAINDNGLGSSGPSLRFNGYGGRSHGNGGDNNGRWEGDGGLDTCNDTNRGSNDDEDEDEPPWNKDLRADGDGPEEEVGLHQNAKSSLEASFIFLLSPLLTRVHQVTMHDLDVRCNKRKRMVARTEVSEADSDSETTHPRSKKPRKKHAGCPQSFRSIKNLPLDRQSMVRAAYPFIQKAVALHYPWPVASPSGIPSVDDDKIEGLIDDVWDDALDALGFDDDTDIDDCTEDKSRLASSLLGSCIYY
ncbi:hypothetical protein B0H17DRAFT_1202898 [Mycena rosella]|uniref:Uncharacterized protein n=1 Tax=Mycena rosella TaxID=1033263 RepID=A0AAD7DEW4_MYCRO|nr:hypothetical protein B0H17DRAFT_1202898 [Mycena rosella]